MSKRAAALVVLFAALLLPAKAGNFRFVKSQSGPSGKIVDNRFQFDAPRSRFVYPQDKSLTVYFEWEAPPGTHVLSALWKDPDGKVATISPDVKMEIKTTELHAYWIFEIGPGCRSGIWSTEIRIDGEPSGSHSFELVVPEIATAPAEPQAPKLPSLDEMYASVGRSLVWVYKLDGGRRADTSLGFVIGANQVATAFQSIDASERVEVVFGDGRKIATNEVWACDRLQDWAVLKVDTGNVPALRRKESAPVPIGDRYIAFNVESEQARVIGGVDITGRRNAGMFGERIQISPSPAREAAGGPLLSPVGSVAGIVGGSVAPGGRFSQYAISMSPGLWSRLTAEFAVTPIESVPDVSGKTAVSFQSLLDSGVLTAPLTPSPSFAYGGTARAVSKIANDTSTTDASEFSRRDQVAWVYTLWRKREKEGKGAVSAMIYDARNRKIGEIPPKKVTLPNDPPIRVAFNFGVQTLPAGVYRVDVIWNDRPAWRTFIKVID